jgi:hypothetical protein
MLESGCYSKDQECVTVPWMNLPAKHSRLSSHQRDPTATGPIAPGKILGQHIIPNGLSDLVGPAILKGCLNGGITIEMQACKCVTIQDRKDGWSNT